MSTSAGEQPDVSGSAGPQQGLEGAPPVGLDDGLPGEAGRSKAEEKRDQRDERDDERNVGG